MVDAPDIGLIEAATVGVSDASGIGLIDQETQLLADLLSVGEEQPAHRAQHQQAGKGLVLGTLSRDRAEHVRAPLAAKLIHRRVGHLLRQRHSTRAR